MKTKVIKRDGLVEGQILTYTGKGFLGYIKGNNLMKFKKIDDKSMFDIWVEYQGQ